MKFLPTLVIALVLAAPGISQAEGIDELVAGCEGCHGPQGASPNSDVPIIGGQSREYLADSLKTFQDWGRPCLKSTYRFGDTSRPRTDMCKVTAGLSKEDIDALSAHYSGLPFVPAKQDFDASQVEAGAALHLQHCESCHGQTGEGLASRGPRLAGQWTRYLKATLKYVPTGEHLVPPMMERTVNDFSAGDINAVMNYYASQQD